MRRYQLLLLLFLFPVFVSAVDITGIVRDASSGELLIGANVYITGPAGKGTTTGLDGSFSLKNVKPGKCVLRCSYISYKTVEKEINVPQSGRLKIDLTLVSYENELSDVIVLGNAKTSDAGVRNIERLSSNVMNIIGARSIEVSPDLNVASVLGRVSGVTMEKNSSGEAEYAVLRGMDKRYNITLVNGVKISSPNNKQRFVPLNIFPSELLDRLEVSKTRLAEMEGDATGGAVNMIMKDAPYRLSVTGNASVGYNAIFLKRDFERFNSNKITEQNPYEKYGKDYSASIADFTPIQAVKSYRPLPNLTAGLSFGNRYLKNKLGFIVAANVQNTNKGANTVYFDDEMTQQDITLKLTDVKHRRYSENQIQYGIHAKIDYKFSPNHELELYNFYVSSEKEQVRYSEKTNFKLHYDPSVGNFDKAYQTRFRTENQHILASMLQGKHKFMPHLHLNWTAVYSQAGLERPDETIINIENLITNHVSDITIDGDGSTREWEHNSDRDLSGLFNLNYSFKALNGDVKLETGGLYRNKKRDNVKVGYTIQPLNTTQKFESLDQIEWKVYNPKGSVGPLTYDAGEDIIAAFLQGRYNGLKLEIIAGARYEYTNQNYFLYHPRGEDPVGKQLYWDILPNIQFKYTPSQKMNWRASYFRSLSRPGFFDIVPYQIQEEEFVEYGNPDLRRSKIDNVDARWEFFPQPNDQLMIGAFYKRIKDPIEYAYYTRNSRQGGLGLTNLGNAQNIGLEIDWIKFIRMLGIKANYTYTQSSITTSKIYYGKTETGDTKTLTTNQTRPLVGQAAHVANLSLLLKDTKNGWDAQLSASYTGDKIAIVSRFLNSDYWDKATFNLDASIEKKFRKGWSVFAKANNLLNTPNIRYVKTNNSFNDKFELQSATSGKTIIRKEQFYQSFLVGVRFKM